MDVRWIPDRKGLDTPVHHHHDVVVGEYRRDEPAA
jgi:hypothetical protein